jgi:hypothetical protein
MFTGSPEKPILGVKVAFVWMTLNIGCWLYVYFFIPELKGLELEQVDELYPCLMDSSDVRFEKGVPPRKSAQWVPTVKYNYSANNAMFESLELKDQATASNEEMRK